MVLGLVIVLGNHVIVFWIKFVLACLIFYSLICSLLYGVSFNLFKIKLTLVVRRFVFISANSELLEHRNRVKNMRDTRMRMQCGQLLGQMHGCLLSWLQYGSIVEDYPPPRSLSFSFSPSYPSSSIFICPISAETSYLWFLQY